MNEILAKPHLMPSIPKFDSIEKYVTKINFDVQAELFRTKKKQHKGDKQ